MSRRTPPPSWSLVAGLALGDQLHEWRLGLTLALGLAAVLVPLLVLFGLKTGVIDAWRARLLADPASLQVVFRQHGTFDEAWFARMAAREDVGFVVPEAFAATVSAMLTGPDGRRLPGLDLLTTAPGDPLLGATPAPIAADALTLTEAAAEALGVGPGDRVTATVNRRRDGQFEAARRELAIAGVVPAAQSSRTLGFAAPALVNALETWRSGRAVPELGVAEGEEAGPVFPPWPRARVYAASLDEVLPLAEALAAEGIAVQPRTAEIARLKAMDATLTLIFRLIAGLGFAGFLFSLAASLWANVERKRRQLAMLHLLGISRGRLAAFPAIQAVLIVGAGFLLSVGLLVLLGLWLNSALAGLLGEGEAAVRMTGAGLAGFAGACFGVGILASLAGGYVAASVEPSEGLLDG